MTHYIEIGNKKRPVRFGWGALYEYESITGRNALEDFDELQKKASVRSVVDIAFSGLSCGYKTERIPVDFTQHDVADWIMGDTSAVTKVMEAFADSFPKTEEAQPAEPAKKKVSAGTK